jgi:aminoglycoside phosphotransferase (APT) family kinase protein
MTNTAETYRAKLQNDFPGLSIDLLKIIGSGWHHDAVEVSGGIVFRIPRGVHDMNSTVESEIAILRLLKDKMPVQIPNPLYVAPDNEYFGYPKVKGALLKDVVGGLDKEGWSRVKEDWVNIAKTIHESIPVEKARELNMPNFLQPGPSTAGRIFEIEGLSQDLLDFASRMLKQEKDLDHSSLYCVFIHNDLQFHNIIADPEAKRICGLIDWTDCCIGPVAREFAIAEWMKPGLLEQVTQLYEQETGVKVSVAEARMWRSLEELSDYVESTEAGDFKDAKETLARIEHMMSLEM